jgi:hypothetical protein
MAVTVTNTSLAIETIQELTGNSQVASPAEVFNITPTRANSKICIYILEGGSTGAVTFSLAAGAFWAAGVALTGSVGANKPYLLFVETAKYLSATGKLVLTLTAATTLVAKVGFVELP